jgi:hypothetical protein
MSDKGSDDDCFGGFFDEPESGSVSVITETESNLSRQSCGLSTLSINYNRILKEEDRTKISLKLDAVQTLSYVDLRINHGYKYKNVLNCMIYYFHIRAVSLDYLNTLLSTRLYNRKQIHLGNAEGKDVCSDVNYINNFFGMPHVIMRTTKRTPSEFFYRAVNVICTVIKSFDNDSQIVSPTENNTSIIKNIKSDIKYIENPIIHVGVTRRSYREEIKVEEIEYSHMHILLDAVINSKKLKQKADTEEPLWDLPDSFRGEDETDCKVDCKVLKGRLLGIKTYKDALISDEEMVLYKDEVKEIEDEMERSKYEFVIFPDRFERDKEIKRKYEEYDKYITQLDKDNKYQCFYRKYTNKLEDIEKYRKWFDEVIEMNKGPLLSHIPEFDFPEGTSEAAKSKKIDEMLDDSMYHEWGDHYLHYYNLKEDIEKVKKKTKLISKSDFQSLSYKPISKVDPEKIKRMQELKTLITKKEGEWLVIEKERELIKSWERKKRFKSTKMKSLSYRKFVKRKNELKLYKKHGFNDVITSDYNMFCALDNDCEAGSEDEAETYVDDYIAEWDDISFASSVERVVGRVAPKEEDFSDAFKIFESTDNFEDLFRTPDRFDSDEIRLNPGANKVPKSRGRYYVILAAKIIRLLKNGEYKKNIDKEIHMVRGCSIKFAAKNIKRLIKRNPELGIRIDISTDFRMGLLM